MTCVPFKSVKPSWLSLAGDQGRACGSERQIAGEIKCLRLDVQIDLDRFSFPFTSALCKYLPATRCSHLLAVPSTLWKAAGSIVSPHPHLALWSKRNTLPQKPQVSLTAPKTNGLWLAAVTNSLIIGFMILHLKLLYNNTQKCLMGSIQSHKNYLLNKRFKTINLLFSINNGFPKNGRQLNVSSAFSPGKVAF